MSVKQAITQQEKDFIGGWYISLLFYMSSRDKIPTGKDLIRHNTDGVTDEEMETFVNAAMECGTALMKSVDTTTGFFANACPELLPEEEDRLFMIKKMACYLGIDVAVENIHIKISEMVEQFLSQMMVNALWKDTNPTEEVIAAIWLEAVGLALTAPKAWEWSVDSDIRAHVETLIDKTFLVLTPPANGKYTIQYPT